MINYFFKNTSIILKNIKYIVKRDLLKQPIINYFNKKNTKSVLISYITKPFKNGMDISHTNSAEALEIARIFSSLNYNVDVADYDYEGFINYKKYDLIFGFGEPMVNSFSKEFSKQIKRVYYGTGMHIFIQNQNTLKRISEVSNIKGKLIINSGRVVEKAWSEQTTLVDAMIVLGNIEVKNSYARFFDNKIYNVDPSFYKVCDYKEIVNRKNFDIARKNYLWFGSSGLIHKGLDMVLETFKALPDLHLHICGPIDSEIEFKQVYYEELFNTPNIHTYGFVKLNSDLFTELIGKCAFNIYPSCSEGGSPSVINVCANGGLIPIITKEVTLDFENFGISIEDLTVNSVKKSVDKSQMISIDDLKKMSFSCGEKMSGFTLDNFSLQIKQSIELILKESSI